MIRRRDLGERFLERVHPAMSRRELRVEAAHSLVTLLRADSVVWGEPAGAPRDPDWIVHTADGDASRPLTRFARSRSRYDLLPQVERARQRFGGLVLGQDTLSQGVVETLPLYQEVLRPARIRTYLFVELSSRGAPSSTLIVSRHGKTRPFGDHDRVLAGSIRPFLALLERLTPLEGAPAREGSPEALRSLTPRELEVATRIVRGDSNKEIAGRLCTSPETVRKQTIRVYQKLGCRGRVELTRAFGPWLDGPSGP